MAAGTVLYINGFGGSMDPKEFLGGMLVEAKDPIINIEYPNQIINGVSETHADTAMNNLDAALGTYVGTAANPTKVVGHSAGASFIYKWIREKGPTSSVDPTKVIFYAVGNPEMKHTGAIWRYPNDHPAIYPGPSTNQAGVGVGWGIPATGVTWELHSVANEYDGWADAPNDPLNDEVERVISSSFFGLQKHWDTSLFCFTKSASGPHSGKAYTKNLDTAFSYNDTAQGTDVWYHWIPADNIPRVNALSWLSFVSESVAAASRPELNEAYDDRPVTLGTVPPVNDPPIGLPEPAPEPFNFFTWLWALLGWS
jgi:hypothetical protein